MPRADLPATDRAILNILQAEFPLAPHPFQEIGRRLGVGEEEVIAAISHLKEMGLVRQISPVIDARRLGFKSTLVAAEVPESALHGVYSTIAAHPGISHAYERDSILNLWLTLSVGAKSEVDVEVSRLGESIGAKAAFSLPAVRLFKIQALFGSDIGDAPVTTNSSLPVGLALTAVDRKIINAVQVDLPLRHAPFTDIAANTGLTEEQLLSGMRSLIVGGAIRRFGASMDHRRAGYAGNGMACWIVRADAVERVGRGLAALRAVSHCYERKTNPFWPYNMFAMFHAATIEDCRKLVAQASESLGVVDNLLLFSTREIKKTRVNYPV